MPPVSLQIVEPPHGAVFTGAATVRLRGAVESPPPDPLFFKWYASLETPAPPGSPLPVPAGGNPLDFVAPLGTGSHVLCFTAKDIEGDDRSSLQSVRHAGLAGGPASPGNSNPCVIHVLTAGIVTPAAAGAVLNRAGATLAAVAPRQWGRRIGTTSTYEPNPDYHAINQVAIVWQFTPVGGPGGRASATLRPSLNEMRFDPSGGPSLIYAGGLPASLDTGAYDLTLRVELISNSQIGHAAVRRVTLV
jgi:hypothetical protein